MTIDEIEEFAACCAALPEPARSLPYEVLRDAYLAAQDTAKDNAHDPAVTVADYFPHCIDPVFPA